MGGALAALANVASAIAALLFGYIYNHFTQGGAAKSNTAAFPALLACSGCGFLGFLMSLSLPAKMPEPSDPLLDTLLVPGEEGACGEDDASAGETWVNKGE